MYRKNLSFFSRNFEIVGNKTEMRISNWVFQENKAHQIFQKRNIFYLLLRTSTRAYQGVKMFVFRKFDMFCFLETLVLRFAPLPYYRRNVKENMKRLCNVSLGITLIKVDLRELMNFCPPWNH